MDYNAATPMFSIGVTSYNRKALLAQALASIVDQTFQDFEVIVGNDYPPEPLSAEVLGLDDPRIRYVNHPRNLGEVGNMNALPGLARGRYFTWLGDDDLYAPDFLAALYAALVEHDWPPCAFTSYDIFFGTARPVLPPPASTPRHAELLSGRQFMRRYFAGTVKVIGVNGVFDRRSLSRIGAVLNPSGAPVGLHGEWMLLMQCGLLDRIAYLAAPLVFFRQHEQSYGCMLKASVKQYAVASISAFRGGLAVLRSPPLRADLPANFVPLVRLCFRGLMHKCISSILSLFLTRKRVESALLRYYQRNAGRQ